jgi:hypothetical protein
MQQRRCGRWALIKHPTDSSIRALQTHCCSPACVSAADVLDDLNDHDALFIVEEDAYERCEALARFVPPPTRLCCVLLLAACRNTHMHPGCLLL